MVMEGGRTFMTACKKEEKKATGFYCMKRKAKGADRTIIMPGVIDGPLRQFRAALLGQLQGPPKPFRLLL